MKITGNYPTIIRRRTGLFSLDVALGRLGSLGISMRTLVELYGFEGVGKSTLSYYLAGRLAEDKDILICDLELLDQSYLPSAIGTEYNGTVHISDTTDKKGKPVSHEVMLQEMADNLYKPENGVAILDSVGGIIPVAEGAGDFGEAFMGRRAKLVAQLARRLMAHLRNKDDAAEAIIVNHVYAILGAKGGYKSAGGDALKFLAQTRLMLWVSEILAEESGTIYGSLVKGKVEKNRYGGKGRTFGFFTIPNYGVHAGASAMFDAFGLGLAERDAKVKIDGKAIGYLKADLLKAARDGNQKKFEPFQEAIQKYEEEWMSSGFPSLPDTEQEPSELENLA